MDAPLLATRASLALSSLTSQLASLESQQSALLTSLSLTSSTLSNLPNYNAIAPTLQQIPTYTTKLSRLRRAMVQQQQEVESLKRRALEAGKRRREHLKKLREREREEAEKDRGVLRARVVSEGASQAQEEGEDDGGRSTPVEVSSGRGTPVQGGVKVVKKRKKARKVEIQ
jgi:flagellar biosynthesis chaperone FliJ